MRLIHNDKKVIAKLTDAQAARTGFAGPGVVAFDGDAAAVAAEITRLGLTDLPPPDPPEA